MGARCVIQIMLCNDIHAILTANVCSGLLESQVVDLHPMTVGIRKLDVDLFLHFDCKENLCMRQLPGVVSGFNCGNGTIEYAVLEMC